MSTRDCWAAEEIVMSPMCCNGAHPANVPKGEHGTIMSGKEWAFTVKFDFHPHYVVCMVDMLIIENKRFADAGIPWPKEKPQPAGQLSLWD
jgi:hypothetical protein